MEDPKKQSNIVASIWRNWCNLEPQQRSQVANRLGPIGHALSIAANVSEFARQPEDAAQTPDHADSGTDNDDVIDAEFEECDT